MGPFIPHPPLPDFEVRLVPPDLSAWIAGNTGIQGITMRDSGRRGPHVALFSLMHGNEFAGAIVLDLLLRTGLVPTVGRLSLGFINLSAFDRFDARRPTASRFIDEDLNRVWDEAILDGPRHSIELDRAREIRAFIGTVDVLLDLHSMLWPSEALILSGTPAKGQALAVGIGTPPLVIADEGHVNGRRLIDYTRFCSAATPYVACLVEAGQHWEQSTVDTLLGSVAGLLRHLGIVAPDAPLPPPLAQQSRIAKVTTAVTAMTSNFAFVQAYRGGDIIARRNTLIAMDGETEIRTPHDDCLLVMPSLRPSRGHTAVRLAKFETRA
ncbi:peptidase M14 [Rhodopila sp.]|uniref:peptidase M14 n=1 Tax=Rhodopila sp. TaxID=2480087 RepID=UPI003D106C23